MITNQPAKQNILVTGGTGLAGQNAIIKLLDEGYSVFAIVREKEKLINLLRSYQHSELLRIIEIKAPEKLSISEMKELIESSSISSVIHIAALVGERRIPWERYLEVNVTWTKNLANAFLEAQVKHKRFIYTSSVGVYGTIPQKNPVRENAPIHPDGKYHKSKVLAEKALLELQSNSNLPLVILRPTILYGNGDTGFLFKLFKLARRKIFPLNSRSPIIHLLDVELLADIYAKAIVRDQLTHNIFNVADPEPTKLKDLVKHIAKCADAGYLEIPHFIFRFLIKFTALSSQYSISLKLISLSWFYSIDHLQETFGLSGFNTVETLDKKYLEWYKRGVNLG